MKNEFDYLNDVKMDFSLYEKEYDSMKRNKNNKKITVLVACIALFTLTTAFASGLVQNVIKSISTGFNTYHQIDADAPVELMDELKGKIFDENGNPLESLTRNDFDKIYDKDGNKIDSKGFAKMIEEATGNLVAISDKDYDPEQNTKNFSTLEEAQKEAVFDIKSPQWMPDGYSLSKAFSYKEENGEISGLYMTLVYKNDEGKEINIFERHLNEETAFEAGTDGDLKEITINGRKAVITNGISLDFETADNVSVIISTRGNVSEAELIKIAQSVK